MSDPASQMIELVRSGDLAGAEAVGEAALRDRADDMAARVALANLKAMKGDLDGAEALCTSESPELLRLRAWLLQSRGRHGEAASCYERVVAGAPSDWESWNNLGNARHGAGDREGAIHALGRARRLRPDVAPIQLNYAMLLAAAGRLEESVEPYAAAARLDPANASVQLELGRTYAGLAEMELAEASYRRALGLEPGLALAWLELGILLERANRLDALAPLLEQAQAQGVPADELAYLQALLLREEGRTAEALALARRAPADVEPARRSLLIGRLADSLGDSAAAFEAFAEANRIAADQADAVRADPGGYRRRVAAMTATLSPEWLAGWAPVERGSRPAPAFLVGFPRSGTTLLDTVLMGHPAVAVLEEAPILQRVDDALGGMERLPDVDTAEAERLRGIYFTEVDRLVPDSAGRTVIDKLPLNLLALPLIHRLFPDARILFAQRHPCDVVLSCFMQSFEINDAMANFLDLADSARLYDLVLASWERSRELLPLDVHVVRYEALVEDVETEARAALDFLGLPFDPAVLDHRRTARSRGTISTPSYSQVIRPIYREASGRWERYRPQMEPVLPILAPWALRLGYGDIFNPER
ncbi:MAG TPA: sulfotransferase [Allosphingosinicella sp.]|jgi:tetratricopeptide (TPR) repeat protein